MANQTKKATYVVPRLSFTEFTKRNWTAEWGLKPQQRYTVN